MEASHKDMCSPLRIDRNIAIQDQNNDAGSVETKLTDMMNALKLVSRKVEQKMNALTPIVEETNRKIENQKAQLDSISTRRKRKRIDTDDTDSSEDNDQVEQEAIDDATDQDAEMELQQSPPAARRMVQMRETKNLEILYDQWMNGENGIKPMRFWDANDINCTTENSLLLSESARNNRKSRYYKVFVLAKEMEHLGGPDAFRTEYADVEFNPRSLNRDLLIPFSTDLFSIV